MGTVRAARVSGAYWYWRLPASLHVPIGGAAAGWVRNCPRSLHTLPLVSVARRAGPVGYGVDSGGVGRQCHLDPRKILFRIHTRFGRMQGANHMDLCAMPKCPQLFQCLGLLDRAG